MILLLLVHYEREFGHGRHGELEYPRYFDDVTFVCCG